MWNRHPDRKESSCQTVLKRLFEHFSVYSLTGSKVFFVGECRFHFSHQGRGVPKLLSRLHRKLLLVPSSTPALRASGPWRGLGLCCSGLWMIILGLCSSSKLLSTIPIIPVKTLNLFFVHDGYVKICLRDEFMFSWGCCSPLFCVLTWSEGFVRHAWIVWFCLWTSRSLFYIEKCYFRRFLSLGSKFRGTLS